MIESDTAEVSIDVDVGLRRMAPFVSPLSRRVSLLKLVSSKLTVLHLHIKDKRAPDLRKPVRRQIGERVLVVNTLPLSVRCLTHLN